MGTDVTFLLLPPHTNGVFLLLVLFFLVLFHALLEGAKKESYPDDE